MKLEANFWSDEQKSHKADVDWVRLLNKPKP